MNKLIILSSALLFLSMCSSTGDVSKDEQAAHSQEVKPVVVGAERLSMYMPQLQGKRVGMLVNQTSRIGTSHLVDSLLELGVDVQAIFAPEHGFRGDHSDGATINSEIDAQTGIPIYSIYGKNKKPSQEMLKNIDLMIFDIQDVGVRFYTFISNMHYVMEACAETQGRTIEMLVLDRPNPNGFYVDGPVLELANQSFIGMHSIPIVHGLTVGELALMINAEGWLKDGVSCDLTVIACENYTHDTYYELPIPPSPNLPNMNSVYLYPFIGLFEGTNISIGRGTATPFQIAGRPGFKGTMMFTPKSIPGVSDHPKYQDQECGGIEIPDCKDSSIFSSKQLNLDYLLLFYQSQEWAPEGDFFRNYFNKLAGNKSFKRQIEQGFTADAIRESWEPELGNYKEMRKKYLLYP